MELILEVPPGYSIERLDTAQHRREGFSCGVPQIDTYLATQASQAQDKNLATTHVLLEATPPPEVTMRPIIGYVTLTSSVLPLNETPDRFKKVAKSTEVKAQLIARMGVDSRYQGKELGQFLLRYALKCCWDIYRLSAFGVVIVDAKDERLKKFYIRYGGFIEMPARPLRLYLPIETVRKLFAPPT